VNSPNKTISLVATSALLMLGVRVTYLFVRYILGSTSTRRFNVESTALLFVACGLSFFERDLLIDASVAPDRNDPCVFQWNDDRGQSVRQGP